MVGVALGDGAYAATGSYSVAFSFSGWLILPMAPILFWFMPESLAVKNRKALSWARCLDALGQQVSRR